MSDIVSKAVEFLNGRMDGGFDGCVKFVIEEEGSIMIDGDGVRAGDEDADCVLTANAETFQGILDGEVKAGDVVVIRYEGPKGGPGMREMLAVTSRIYGQGMGEKVALVTDGNDGIGFGMAQGLAQAGADVVVWGTPEVRHSVSSVENVRP